MLPWARSRGGQAEGEEEEELPHVDTEVTPQEQKGVVSRNEIAPLHMRIDEDKRDEVTRAVAQALEAAHTAVAKAKAAALRSSAAPELLEALNSIQQRFLSEREQQLNALAQGAFSKVVKGLGGDSTGGGSDVAAAQQRPAELKVMLERAQRLSNVMRSRQKIQSASLLGACVRIASQLLIKQSKVAEAGGADARSQLAALDAALVQLDLMLSDCVTSATIMFNALLEADKSPKNREAVGIISNMAVCLKGGQAGIQAAVKALTKGWLPVLELSTAKFAAATAAHDEARRHSLLPSSRGPNVRFQDQTLLLACAACTLEQLCQLATSLGFPDVLKFKGSNGREACLRAAKEALKFAAAVIPAELCMLGRGGRSPLLLELQSQTDMAMKADALGRQDELARANFDLFLYTMGGMEEGQLCAAAYTILKQQNKLAGGQAQGGSGSSSQPSTPSGAPPRVFEPDTDLQPSAEQSADSLLLAKEFGDMSLAGGASSSGA